VLCGILGVPPAQAQDTAPAGDLTQIRAQADKGDLESLNALGNAYTNGLLGLKQDYAEALAWYRRAAEKGFAPAQFNLGLAYELGRGVRADERQAFKYYLMAAEQGFAAAQFNVGNMYSAGRGVGQDFFESNLWFKQAAEKGIVEAQFNLGLAYEAGRGVKKDEVAAARWYKQAADRGFPRAQYNLGLLLEDGRGVAKNEAVAAVFYRAAAEQGFAPAQNNYGLMISEGRGDLAKDPVEAYFWLSLAVANGANPAARDFVAQSLTAAELAAGNKRLNDLKAGAPPPAVVATPAPVRPAPGPAATTAAPADSAATARMAELTAALEKARQANAQFAEANQKLELEKARLEQELNSQATGSETAKLIEQLRGQSSRLSAQVQSLLVDKETAERDAKILAAQVKDAQDELARARAAQAGAPAAVPAGEISRYQGEIAALTTKLGQAMDALTQAQRTQQELTEANARLQSEKADLAAASGADPGKYPVQSGDKDSIIAHLQRDNARLNEEVKRSTLELLSLNSQLRTLRASAGAAKPATDNTASAEMRAESQRVDSNNERLQSQRDAAVADAANLAGQLHEARAEITRLNQQIQVLGATRQSADAANDQLAQLTAKVAQAAQEAARLQTDNARLLARVAELEKQPKQDTTDKSLAPRLAEAQQTVAQLQAQLQAAQREKTELDNWAQSLEKTLNGKSAAAAELAGREMADLRAKLAQAEAQLTEARQAGQDNSALQSRIDQLMADNARIGRQLTEVTATAATQKQTVQKLAAENSDLTEQVRRAETALAARPAKDETGPLRQQLAEAQDRVERAAREKQALTDKVAAEHSSYLQAQARLTTLETELRNAQKKPAPVNTAAIDDLKQQLAEANSALEKSSAAVAELTAANDRLEKQTAAQEGMRRELASAKLQLVDLQQQLSAAKQSGSEVAGLRDENNRLRLAADEAAALKAKAEQLTRDNDQLAGLISNNRRDLTQAQVRVADLEKQLAEARTISTRGGDDAIKLRADLSEANQGLERLNATVAELTAANDRLEQDLDSARKSTAAALAAQSQAVSAAQPDAYKMEIGTLQARIKEIEGQIEEERSNAAKEIATMASQLARTRETNKSLTEANRALLNAKQAEAPTVDKGEFDQLQSRVRDLTAVADEVRRQNQKLTDDNQRLASERESLTQQLEDARKVATVLPGLSDEKAALQERLEAVGAQLLRSQQEVDTLQKEHADATSQLFASRQAAEKAQAELAAVQSRTAEAEKAAESHNTSVAELTEANTKLEGERNDLQRQLAALRADNIRLTQTSGNLEQLKADAERSARQNIEALTAQLAQTRRDLQSARDANSRLVEGNVAQERDRVAVIAQLQQQNSALAARLAQAQGTLDQIASAARLGTPASAIAAGNPAPIPTVRTAPAPAEVRYHTVTEGDSLSRISMRYYGTANRWQEIFNANRDVLQGSSVLRVGMQLRIP
jgi:TPR repeat protein/nucleoid-associated protein YgaU